MLGFSQDDSSGLVMNTGAIMVFMRELGWPDGIKWVTKNVSAGGKVNRGGVTYEITVIPGTGVMLLSAKPDLNNSEVQRLVAEKRKEAISGVPAPSVPPP